MKRILALLTFVLTLGLLATPALASPTSEPPAVANDSSTAKLRIVDVAAPILKPGQDLTVTVEVTNTGAAPLHIASFDLRAQSSTAISDTSIYRWMKNTTPASWVATLPMDRTVAPGATFTTQLTFSRADINWPTESFNWGPRGIEIAVVDTERLLASDRTMVVAAPSAEIVRYPATAVVAISDAVTKRAHINTLLNTEITPSPAAETQQVTEWDMAGVSLLVDRSLAVQTKHATQLPLPTYDADIAALAALGLEAKARQLGADAVYLPQGSPNETAIKFAQKLGMKVLIPDSSYAPLTNLTYTPSAVTTYGGDTILATNSTVSEALAGRLSVWTKEAVTLDDLDIRQVSIALSAVHQRQRPNDARPYVVSVPRDASPAAQAAVTAILKAPWVEPTSVSDLLKREPDATKRFLTAPAGRPTGAITSSEIEHIDFALAKFSSFASIFPDADAKVSAATTASEALYSVAWRLDPSERATHIHAISPTREQLESIAVTTSSTINLISESSALPIQVTNDFDQPVTVTVRLDTPDARLRAPEPVQAQIPASSSTTISIPVEANGSGNLDVDVKLANKDGVLVGSPYMLHVRVRADWESVGTVFVAGLVGVVFLVGLVKSIRDGRRSDPVPPDDFVAAAKQS
ncbi:DUF6049 family protein [Trueperella pyogenes]|uniref:DUF6049 family protein n=1 Tax=Trueperella pyogenes TaxID=1661 RepID=UPI000D2565F5|nr:DUF6049 family protein [Trueperella pyogenes]AWA43866.1 hypothetical protein DBV13_07520 [Trueperella pyogenes]